MIRKTLSLINTGVTILFVVSLLIVLSPLIIVVVAINVSVDQYTKLWQHIRKDPERDIEVDWLDDDDWQEANTKDEFVKSFQKVTAALANSSSATPGEISYDGFGVFKEPHPEVSTARLNLSQTLTSGHAEVRLSFDFSASTRKADGQIYAISDEEDRCGDSFPPVVAEIVKPELHPRPRFTIQSNQDAWMVMGFLRGTVKQAAPNGQLWAHIPEHQVWLVRYKTNRSYYGLRNEFSNGVAHKFRRDEQITVNK